jgi:hypothetical protein
VIEGNRAIASRGRRAPLARATRGVVRLAVAAVAALGGGACMGDLDPAWQLNHDRIIAVRATPPSIASGQSSTIDALLGTKGAKTSVAAPELAMVVSPASLASALTFSGGAWTVTAPSAERLAAARTELKLAADAAVPLEIGVAYANQTLVATKVIKLGTAADNPALVHVMINGQPASDAEIVVGKLVPVPLSIEADDAVFDVTWLTSCGTMHDFDLPAAHLQVEAKDPTAGELAVVLRDAQGGVSWQVWPIHAE